MAAILAGLTVLLAVVAWAPIMWNQESLGIFQQDSSVRTSVVLLSANFALQLAFIILVCADLVTLSYSVGFAVIGVPACLWAVAAAFRAGAGTAKRIGVIVSGLGSVLLWGFLCILH